MKRALLLTLFVVLIVARASSQNAAGAAESLTVEVFSTRTLHTVTITPIGSAAFIQSCEKCRQQSVVAPFSITVEKGEIQLSSGERTTQVHLRGFFRIKIPDTESIAAAAGKWTVEPHTAGLRVLLTMPVERYVAAALNGEASPEEPVESLKAMAVAMRTFAIENSRRHSNEGFDFCDSTHCQALRIGPTRSDVERAVRDTAGGTLWFKQQRAAVYYSQNCGGKTEDAGSVWPSIHAPYLISHPDAYCVRHKDAAWQAQFPLDQLSRLFREEGWHTPTNIDSIRILKRTPSGRAITLQVSGAGSPASISASSFHFVVNRSLGWNQIRSDWYELETSNRTLLVKGKGHGHGVGLCQDGAFEMASEGKSYREILAFYFPGTTTRVSAGDDGWKSTQGNGWKLRAVGPATNFWIDLGNSQWEKARSAFPTQAIPSPTVYAMPSTELFRQTTGEPGWLLASTRGTDIFLQPASVLQKNGATSNTLLHEFLHILVEQDSSEKAPLWLREGIVEFLADGPMHHEKLHEVNLMTLDANLSHPADRTSSQTAHVAAAGMVAAFVRQYGFATVREWLRNGVPTEIIRTASR